MENRELICIGCPLGCRISVTLDQGDIKEITGNTCVRGEDYARKEVLHPERTVTSTVCVEGGTINILPVRTKSDVPKDKIFDVMDALKDIVVQAPVHIGDPIVENVAGTGVNVVASKDVLRQNG